MAVTGLFYLGIVRQIPVDAPAMGLVGPLIPYVIALIALLIIVQVVLAILSPRDAEKPADERERRLIDKDGNWSGVVLGVAMIQGALQFIWTGHASLMFHWIVAGLILSQIAEYALQIFLFRRGY